MLRVLTILNFPRDSFSFWNMSSSKLKGYFVCCGGGGGGPCGGLLIGFCAFWFSCTMSSDCRLETNRPFTSLNLGRAGCFGGFGLSGWILMNRPVFGSLGGMCFMVGFVGDFDFEFCGWFHSDFDSRFYGWFCSDFDSRFYGWFCSDFDSRFYGRFLSPWLLDWFFNWFLFSSCFDSNLINCYFVVSYDLSCSLSIQYTIYYFFNFACTSISLFYIDCYKRFLHLSKEPTLLPFYIGIQNGTNSSKKSHQLFLGFFLQLYNAALVFPIIQPDFHRN